jgi:hypothetical protein
MVNTYLVTFREFPLQFCCYSRYLLRHEHVSCGLQPKLRTRGEHYEVLRHCCEVSHNKTDRHNHKESINVFAFLSTQSNVTAVHCMSLFLCKSDGMKVEFINTTHIIYSTRM